MKTLVQKVFDYAEEEVSFVFQGGEPTLAGLEFYKAFIDMQNKFNKKHISVCNSIQTNGYNLDEKWAAFFRKHNFLVGLSMDGTKELHDSLRTDKTGKGTYTNVMKSVGLLEEHNVNFNIICVVTNFTARHPKKVFTALKKYHFLQFIPCIDDFSGEKKNYSLTNKRYADFLCSTFDDYYRCIKQDNYVSVRNFDNYIQMLCGRPPENCAMNGRCIPYFLAEWDGSIYCCDFYVLDKWKLGNIMCDSLAEIYNGDKMKQFIAESFYVSEKCKKCKWFMLCRGGCKRDREPIVNGVLGENRLCNSYKIFFEHSYLQMREVAHRIRNARFNEPDQVNSNEM